MFENALIELNKIQAPSLLLEDYNYFINKAINQFINKTYNLYEVNQQKTDDLRVLKSSVILEPELQTIYPPVDDSSSPVISNSPLFKTTYEVDLPDDYLHILNCIIEYDVTKNYKCYNKDSKVHFGAKRLTSDMYSQILHNYFMKPSYKNPYYYINNFTTTEDYPTEGTVDTNEVVFSDDDNIERIGERRYGNKSKVRMEIRFGKDDAIFKPSMVYVDYLKSPRFIRLTQEQVDQVEDTSQVLEFPDYICQEILNELTMLLLENSSDPRLQTNIPVSQSIANPMQQEEKR